MRNMLTEVVSIFLGQRVWEIVEYWGEYGALEDTVLETSKPAMLAVTGVESEAAVG